MALKLNIGDSVAWISSNLKKTGRVVAVIPAGALPREVDPAYKKLEAATPRNEESYVVLGSAARGGREALYWPRPSLLCPTEALTDAELEWCKANPAAIRRVMQVKS